MEKIFIPTREEAMYEFYERSCQIALIDEALKGIEAMREICLNNLDHGHGCFSSCPIADICKICIYADATFYPCNWDNKEFEKAMNKKSIDRYL